MIEYSDRRFPIPYEPEQRRRVLEPAEEIRRDRRAANVAWDHHDAWNCGRCSFSATCGQTLARR